MLKYDFIKDHTFAKDLFKSKLMNMDDIDYDFLLDKKKLFYYNKTLYKDYILKNLKHPKSPNKPWYKNFLMISQRKIIYLYERSFKKKLIIFLMPNK